ncbi:MAG: hypothetical protein J2P46_21605 [Zavarzinella sp.]|nr:hypothetical protein [Zavarzinella sp.]
MSVQIRTLEKGLTPAQVKERLGLTGETPGMVAGTTMSQIFAFRIGRTHDLILRFGRGANDWEFYHAELQPTHAESRAAEVEWPLTWPKAAKP